MRSLCVLACYEGSVRMWTVQGEFMGMYGTDIPVWNIKHVDVPEWKPGEEFKVKPNAREL